MSRRARAAAFAAAALVCAGLSAGLTGGYRADVADQLGPLRPVLVARQPLPAGRVLEPEALGRATEIRRVPSRFAPPGALVAASQAVGLAPAAPIPAGAYVLADQLDAPAAERQRQEPRLDSGRRPVEIMVAAAGALTTGSARGRRVDVVVTTEPGPGRGPGRTYVAAEDVELLDLRSAGGNAPSQAVPGSPAETWMATLALTRAQALRLIQAESFARSVRLIPL
jgi:Flp pilus assembly protein CpaB